MALTSKAAAFLNFFPRPHGRTSSIRSGNPAQTPPDGPNTNGRYMTSFLGDTLVFSIYSARVRHCYLGDRDRPRQQWRRIGIKSQQRSPVSWALLKLLNSRDDKLLPLGADGMIQDGV